MDSLLDEILSAIKYIDENDKTKCFINTKIRIINNTEGTYDLLKALKNVVRNLDKHNNRTNRGKIYYENMITRL